MFKEAEFSSFLADKTIPDYTGDEVSILDSKSLEFKYVSATTTVSDIATYSSLGFSLKGSGRIIWDFNVEELQNALQGIKKNEATNVFSKYSSISNAQAEVRPFWATTFPEDAKNIQVTIILEPKQ
jgi:hypothetical protein